jgi:hypothetical protein
MRVVKMAILFHGLKLRFFLDKKDAESAPIFAGVQSQVVQNNQSPATLLYKFWGLIG